MKTYTSEEQKALARISKRMKAREERKRFKQTRKFAAFKDYSNTDEVDLSIMSHING